MSKLFLEVYNYLTIFFISSFVDFVITYGDIDDRKCKSYVGIVIKLSLCVFYITFRPKTDFPKVQVKNGYFITGSQLSVEY